MARVPEVMTAVHDEYLEQYGEPDVLVWFRDGEDGFHGPLPRVQVMVWRPAGSLDITTVATVGMAARALPGVSHRAELRLSVAGLLDRRTELEAARFLAGLAGVPWLRRRSLDWWELVSRVGPIPAFPSCAAVLLHPRFTSRGWDRSQLPEGPEVHFLNAVPITEEERLAARADLPGLRARWRMGAVDLLCDRSVAAPPPRRTAPRRRSAP